ncbi:unnamed protein product [Microthlaspi erraticum]|uniref:Uncharacterized protein n=1 Tax=Microthlaspi erraticum TaxID=1685480 RepID=A0A6D2IHS5_9BRAS|nr:unnamed protein product [Microthlaspi erraticum]
MNTRIESNVEWMRDFSNVTKLIGERLSPLKLSQYTDLLKQFKSRRIEGEELIRSLQVLFEEDEHLSQMFNELIRSLLVLFEEGERLPQLLNELEEEEIRERKKSEIQQEEHRRRLRCEIGRDEADKPLKKRSKYRVEPTGTVLEPQGFKSEINQNCGKSKNLVSSC